MDDSIKAVSKNKPVVSVVMRAFNCERYIGKAVESLLLQTFRDFEIIIVDDASTDRTSEIINNLVQEDRRIKVFTNSSNQGSVKTMNIGLQNAQGEFVAVHDADDLSLPHRLKTQVDFLRANSSIALVGGGAYVIDEEDEEVKVINWGHKEPDQARQHLERGYSFIHTSLLFRREAIEAIDYYDEFFAAAHDYDMLVRMSEKFDLIYYEEPLIRWRWLNDGITGRKKQAQAAFLELSKIRHQAKKKGLTVNLEKEYDRFMTAPVTVTSSQWRDRPISDAAYYYNLGLLLLKKGKLQQARRRFLKALKYRSCFPLLLRIFVFYGFTFFPGVIETKPIQGLRRIF